MFDNEDEQFIQWIENLEIKCQQLIFDKGDVWFENKLDKNDIESAFSSPMKIYKSGKKYLIRVNIKLYNINNILTARIYNENEVLLGIDDILSDTNIISILEIQGIKFTSRNFQIEIEMKQTMVLNTEIIFDNCLIKTNKKQPLEKVVPNPPQVDLLNHQLEVGLLQPFINDDLTDQPAVGLLQQAVGLAQPFLKVDQHAVGLAQPFLKVDKNTFLEKLSDDILNDDIINTTSTESVENNDEDSGDEDSDDEDSDEEEEKPSLVFGKELTRSINNNNNNNELEEMEFDLQELEKLPKEESDELKEINIEEENSNTLESSMTLKKPNQVYYELYNEAKKRAKENKKQAIIAFLEAKNIKKTYMLENLDESDEEESFSKNIN